MAGVNTSATVVQHRGCRRDRDLAGLLVGELPGRVVGRDLGKSQPLHQTAGSDADNVGRGQVLAASSHDHVNHAQMRMHAMQSFRIEETPGLNGLVQRSQHNIRGGQQPINEVPGAGRVEVQREAALARVVEDVAKSAFRVVATLKMRAANAQCIASRRLDPNHVGAKVGQPARSQTEALVAQVNHNRAGQWKVGNRH